MSTLTPRPASVSHSWVIYQDYIQSIKNGIILRTEMSFKSHAATYIQSLLVCPVNCDECSGSLLPGWSKSFIGLLVNSRQPRLPDESSVNVHRDRNTE